ncbi:DUF2892 domain-containing protein [Bacillus sp. J33]|uniref:DUF2892 domain-containing protein n=1 Tax=Bacillus sp. J33 TaxID=935836 RepID=UPI00047CF942|nr:DUF2892 domain-containing protein [Bacillus sp. J33]
MKNILPATTNKVNLNTSHEINYEINKETLQNIRKYFGKSEEEINRRIEELNHEWDTERVLELNMATIAAASSVLGLFHNKKWMALSGIVSVFMIQHSLQGWCPPLSIIRRLGVRTASEIMREKEALAKLKQKV